jgi:hypothetical protein
MQIGPLEIILENGDLVMIVVGLLIEIEATRFAPPMNTRLDCVRSRALGHAAAIV